MFMVSIGFSDVLYALDLLIFTQPGLSEGRSPQCPPPSTSPLTTPKLSSATSPELFLPQCQLWHFAVFLTFGYKAIQSQSIIFYFTFTFSTNYIPGSSTRSTRVCTHVKASTYWARSSQRRHGTIFSVGFTSIFSNNNVRHTYFMSSQQINCL